MKNILPQAEERRGTSYVRKILHTDGSSKKGNHHRGDAGSCAEGIPHRGGNPGSGGERTGGDLRQQKA